MRHSPSLYCTCIAQPSDPWAAEAGADARSWAECVTRTDSEQENRRPGTPTYATASPGRSQMQQPVKTSHAHQDLTAPRPECTKTSPPCTWPRMCMHAGCQHASSSLRAGSCLRSCLKTVRHRRHLESWASDRSSEIMRRRNNPVQQMSSSGSTASCALWSCSSRGTAYSSKKTQAGVDAFGI